MTSEWNINLDLGHLVECKPPLKMDEAEASMLVIFFYHNTTIPDFVF